MSPPDKRADLLGRVKKVARLLATNCSNPDLEKEATFDHLAMNCDLPEFIRTARDFHLHCFQLSSDCVAEARICFQHARG